MLRFAVVLVAAVGLLAGCRDDEKILLKAENHRLRRELTAARGRVTELESDLFMAKMSTPPPQVPQEPPIQDSITTGGVGQRSPVTGPPIAAAFEQYRRPTRPRKPAPAPTPVGEATPTVVLTGQALSLAPAAPAAPSPAPRELVPLTPEQLQAFQGSQ